jgi:hypothetical protein
VIAAASGSLKRSFRRAALLTPPLALLLSALLILLISPFAWGKGAHVGLPDWLTTFNGLIFGTPGVLIGAYCLQDTWKRTRHGFSAGAFQIAAGLFFLVVGTALQLVIAVQVADPDTYDRLRDANGGVMSPSAFIFTNLLGLFIAAAMVGLTAYTYGKAITVELATRYDRLPGEPDAVGELLRGRNP